MKGMIVIALFLILGSGHAWAAVQFKSGTAIPESALPAKNIDDACARLPCLHDVRIKLIRTDGTTFDRTYKQLPPNVQHSTVAVYAGQTIHVEAEIDHGKLVHLHAVDTVKHPKRTLTFHLWQDPTNGMMLTVSNPFDKMLKFHMGMMPLAHPVVLKTSSCPVIAHGFGMENWPDPLFQVIITDGHFVEAGHHPGCVY